MTAAMRVRHPAGYRAGWIASAILLTLMLATLLAAAARAADAGPPVERLTGRILGPTPMMGDLHELTDRIGGRISGTPACDSAIVWAQAKLQALKGVQVYVEPFTMPVLWTPRGASAACIAPAAFPLHVAASPGTGSTPDGGPIEATAIDAGSGSPEEFAQLGDKAKGAIALVHNPEMTSFEELFGEYMKASGILEGAEKAGIAAVLIESSRPRDLLYRHPMTVNGTVSAMPVAIIAREEAERLFRLAADGEVRVRLAIDAPVVKDAVSNNVVATIRGTDKAAEVVVVGAHLDAWDLGTGANDNGVSCAQVIDLARQIKALGLKPRRTIAFILFTGEEQGMLGSRAWVEHHAAQLDKVVANVVFDTGSGRLAGFYLDGREDIRPALDAALAPVASLGRFTNPIDALDGTDNFDFLLSGIPNFVGAQDPAPYLPDYHASSDTFDKVDAREAKAAEAVLGALVWGLANADGRPGPRQSRAEVEKLLHDTKLDEQMKTFGQWEEWEAGTRGK
jgi:carboxypeptidase Q